MWWLFLVYVVVVGVIFILSYGVSYLANIWEHKTKLSSSIIAGLIIGFITGIPELIVNITSSISDSLNSSIGAGDVMGSNLLNFAFLGFGAFLFYKYFKKTIVTKIEMINMFSLLGIYVLYVIGFAIDTTNHQLSHVFSIFSIVGFIVWIVNAYFLTKANKHPIQNHKNNFLWRMDIKKFMALFITLSFLLIGASVGVTYLCNSIINKLNWDPAFGGSIFVSLSTALAEVISCLVLFYLKNPNAAVSTMIGSNIFNIFTLFVNDLITSIIKPSQALFQPDRSSMWLAIFALIGCISFLIALFLLKWKTSNNKWERVLIIATTSLTASTYPIYIIVCVTSQIYSK